MDKHPPYDTNVPATGIHGMQHGRNSVHQIQQLDNEEYLRSAVTIDKQYKYTTSCQRSSSCASLPSSGNGKIVKSFCLVTKCS